MIPVSEMPPLAGLEVPRQLYRVLDRPAPLAGMRGPARRWPWPALREAGFAHVVNLASDHYDPRPSPLALLHAVQLEDLVRGGDPRDPAAESARVREAARAVLGCLRAGEGVVVHCHGGRGRTGTVLGCCLVALGRDPEEVIAYLDAVHRARGRPGWPESPWQAEQVRRFGAGAQEPA